MPRVGRGGPRRAGPAPAQPAAQRAPAAVLRTCLEALLRGDPACGLGATEFGCGCCAGQSTDLVDSLCAFCLHSEPARAFFVASGGLEALQLAAQSPAERTAAAALQVLQCACTSAAVQAHVVSAQPQLLHHITRLALGQGCQHGEGVQQAAMALLAGWAAEGSGAGAAMPFSAWAVQQQVDRQSGAFEHAGPGSAGTAPTAQAHQAPAPERQQQHLLLHVAMSGLLQPSSLVVRKAGARLFAAAATAAAAPPPAAPLQPPPPSPAAPIRPNPPSLLDACASDARALVARVRGLLDTQAASASVPCFEAFAAMGGAPMLDAATFLRGQASARGHRAACHALLHLTAELCLAGPRGRAVLRAAALPRAALRVFEAAWGVAPHAPEAAAAAGAAGAGGSAPGACAAGAGGAWWGGAAAPFAFLQDHESRELALDVVLTLMGSPATLQLVWGGGEGGGAGEPWAGPGEGSGPPREGEQLGQQEQGSLRVLLATVEGLLQKQSAAHVRAALSMLGHVRFSCAPAAAGCDGSQAVAAASSAAPACPVAPTAPPAQGSVQHEGQPAPPHQQWMQLLCTLFDAAWEAETHKGQQQPQHQRQHQQYSCFPSPCGTAEEQTAAAGPSGRHVSACGLAELGLGCRVLVQVLQAWRQLLDSRQAAVLAALEATEWRARARQATAHPKHLVASAAAKLLPPPGLAPAHAPAAREGGAGVWEAEYSLAGPASALHGRLDAEEALACVQQLAAVQQPSASSASSGVPVPFQWAEGEALQAPIGPAMLDDPDMLAFLDAFLEDDGAGGPGQVDAAASSASAVPGTARSEDDKGGGAHPLERGSQGALEDADGMFVPFQAAGAPDGALAEALLLLPDLQHMAQQAASMQPTLDIALQKLGMALV